MKWFDICCNKLESWILVFIIKKRVKGRIKETVKKKKGNVSVEIGFGGKKILEVFTPEEVSFNKPFSNFEDITIEISGKPIKRENCIKSNYHYDSTMIGADIHRKMEKEIENTKLGHFSIKLLDCNGVPYSENESIRNKCFKCGRPIMYGVRCLKK